MKTDNLVLSIETSLKQGSLTLFKGGRKIGSWAGNEVVSRSEDLVSGIEQLLEQNKFTKDEIDLIAVSLGPGSFTGLRVGIAIARGLSFAVNCRLAGVPLFEAMAYYYCQKNDLSEQTKIFCLVSAGRGFIYFQEFTVGKDNFEPTSEIKIETISNLCEIILKERKAVVVSEKNMETELSKLKEIGSDVTFIQENLSEFVGLYILKKEKNRIKFDDEINPIYVRQV